MSSNPPQLPDPMEEFIRREFAENYARLRFEVGHGLSADVQQAALDQALLYWRRLRQVAENVTDTEVRLTLPGQKTKRREFCIEGVVDIVRENDRYVMYDLKTRDPDQVDPQEREEFEAQLNVYAHIYQKLREHKLDEMKIIMTRFPKDVEVAWTERNAHPEKLEEALAKWEPTIKVEPNQEGIEATVARFGAVVDKIEDGEFGPRDAAFLGKVREETAAGSDELRQRRKYEFRNFATRVCRNCDGRFSCDSYRQYMKRPKDKGTRQARAFNDLYLNYGDESELEARRDAVLEGE